MPAVNWGPDGGHDGYAGQGGFAGGGAPGGHAGGNVGGFAGTGAGGHAGGAGGLGGGGGVGGHAGGNAQTGAGFGGNTQTGAGYGTGFYPQGSSAALADSGGCKCCGVGCAICDSCCADGPGVMTWVGDGRGDFSTETSYQFVGQGMGDHAVTRAPNNNYFRCLICGMIFAALAILGLILGLLFWPSSTTTTTSQAAEIIAPEIVEPQVTTTTTPAPLRKCEFWGDPHIMSFDHAHLNFYGNGDHWIVQSPDLKIQGRFLGTEYTLGLAATNKVAIGGPALGSHIIELGCMDCGPLMVDGSEILKEEGYYKFTDLPGVAIRYDEHGILPDPDQEDYDHRVLHVYLPNDVEVTIFRWKNYVDMRVVMRPGDGIDGACGNFNDDASDDTTNAVMTRVGAQIAAADNLFQKPLDDVPFTDPMRQMLMNRCTGGKAIEARSSCIKLLPPGSSENLLHNCMFNYCFGDMRHALNTAKLYA